MSGPTPDTPKARRPIESKAQLIEELSSGSKPKDQWRIGTEHDARGIAGEALPRERIDLKHGK